MYLLIWHHNNYCHNHNNECSATFTFCAGESYPQSPNFRPGRLCLFSYACISAIVCGHLESKYPSPSDLRSFVHLDWPHDAKASLQSFRAACSAQQWCIPALVKTLYAMATFCAKQPSYPIDVFISYGIKYMF